MVRILTRLSIDFQKQNTRPSIGVVGVKNGGGEKRAAFPNLAMSACSAGHVLRSRTLEAIQ